MRKWSHEFLILCKEDDKIQEPGDGIFAIADLTYCRLVKEQLKNEKGYVIPDLFQWSIWISTQRGINYRYKQFDNQYAAIEELNGIKDVIKQAVKR